MSKVVAELRGVSTAVLTRGGALPVVQDFDLVLRAGETVAIVGESGCGKSMTALSIMRLLPEGEVRLESGKIRVGEHDIAELNKRDVAKIRGREVAMIFQDPMSALNPVMTIGRQLEEAIAAHIPMSRKARRERALELLKLVQISSPEARYHDFPHRLSGGMCQRVSIAMAIACDPDLLIADEPTTALDVTIQAQVLQLLQHLKTSRGMGMLFITHDFGVVAEMADRVVVMYAGRKVEEADVRQLFAAPLHPYTAALMSLTLSPGKASARMLPDIKGMVPPIGERPAGCAFAPRCPLAMDICRSTTPPLVEQEHGHFVACWAAETGKGEDATALRH